MGDMPRPVARRIIDAAARGEVVVVVPRDGSPARVFRLEKYLKMKSLPTKVRPWAVRKLKAFSPDPLHAVDGRVLLSIRRKNIYA